jgi:predicted nucleic acid-binding protein
LGDGLRGGTTTPEVIQEFVHVRASRRSRDDAVQLGRAYRDLLSPLVQVGESELETGLRLFTEMPGLGCFDAVLASVALANSAEALVSADSAFAAVPGLTVAAPSDPGFAELLGI